LLVQITIWLGMACYVKIARKGLWGTKWGWRASDGFATEGPGEGEKESTCIESSMSRATGTHILRRITSLLNHVKKWFDAIKWNHMYGNGELTCSRWYCSNDEDKLVQLLWK
jgi:hypothetical protein